MRVSKQIFLAGVPLGIFLILAVVLWRGLGVDPKVLPSTMIAQPAPAFELTQLRNPEQKITQNTLKGHWTLLNVWASWCLACRQEHGVLMTIAREGRVPVYGLNYKDDPKEALAWLARYGNPYQKIAADRAGQVAIDWGVYGTPETFLINPAGLIVYKHVGPLSQSLWANEIKPQLRQGR